MINRIIRVILTILLFFLQSFCKNRCLLYTSEQELRRHILLFVVSAAIILVLAIAGGSFISRAQAPGETVYYKYFTSIRIESGDSLWTLADTYADGNFESREAFIREVIRTNHLLDENINAGDYLIIPYYSAEFK